MRRIFIAIKIVLSKELEVFLREFKKELSNEKIRWIDSNNFHITLSFLGETSEKRIEEIRAAFCKTIGLNKSFRIELVGLGFFKSDFNPKAIWLGVRKSECLNSLKKRVDILLGHEDSNNKDFKPHLTIGRTKNIIHKQVFKKLILKYSDRKFQEYDVKEVLFYESVLSCKGAAYKIIEKFNLS